LLYEDVVEAVGRFRFHDALHVLWNQVQSLNREIEAIRPWALPNEPPLHNHLTAWVKEIRILAHNLHPFLPETAERIEVIFSQERISRGEPLFPRL